MVPHSGFDLHVSDNEYMFKVVGLVNLDCNKQPPNIRVQTDDFLLKSGVAG